MVPMRVIDVNVPRPISPMMLSLKYNRLHGQNSTNGKIKGETRALGGSTLSNYKIHYRRNRIPRKLLASKRLILLCDIFSTRSTEFRANVPRVISPIALCDTLHQPSFVKSAMCDESNLAIRLWLISSASRSRKFLNWFRFKLVILLPCKSSVFNLRNDCTNSTGTSDTFPFEMCKRSSRWLAKLFANESTSSVAMRWLSNFSDVNLPRIYTKVVLFDEN